jgi:tripartite-type tricarboxylate transporter receptor subunit TctC
MRFLSRLTCVLAILAASTSALPQDYPSKPIRIIVPLSAGSLTDTTIRLMAPKMNASLGVPIIVDNVPGAAGIIGTVQAAKAAPDGYTMLVAAASSFSVNPHVNKNLPYNPVKDFSPVCRIGGATIVLAVNPSLGVKTVPELVEKSKAGAIPIASAGVGTISHLAQEMFKSRLGGNFLHVPYKGSAQSITDTVGGHSEVIFDSPGPMLGHIQSGKLIPLAVMSSKRSASLPNVPTFDELGYKGMYLQGWIAFALPAGAPVAVVNKLAQACQSAIASPEMQEQLLSRGLDLDYAGPSDFGAFVANELPKWGNLVKLAGMKPE